MYFEPAITPLQMSTWKMPIVSTSGWRRWIVEYTRYRSRVWIWLHQVYPFVARQVDFRANDENPSINESCKKIELWECDIRKFDRWIDCMNVSCNRTWSKYYLSRQIVKNRLVDKFKAKQISKVQAEFLRQAVFSRRQRSWVIDIRILK